MGQPTYVQFAKPVTIAIDIPTGVSGLKPGAVITTDPKGQGLPVLFEGISLSSGKKGPFPGDVTITLPAGSDSAAVNQEGTRLCSLARADVDKLINRLQADRPAEKEVKDGRFIIEALVNVDEGSNLNVLGTLACPGMRQKFKAEKAPTKN